MEIFKLDVSTSPDVFVRQHPIHETQYRFSFIITHRLNSFSDFYILIDKGAIVGDRSCGKGGSPWEGINDPNFWSFSTNDKGKIRDYCFFCHKISRHIYIYASVHFCSMHAFVKKTVL